MLFQMKFNYPPLFAVGRISFLLPEAAFYLSAMKNSRHANWLGETSATWKLYIKRRQAVLKKKGFQILKT